MNSCSSFQCRRYNMFFNKFPQQTRTGISAQRSPHLVVGVLRREVLRICAGPVVRLLIVRADQAVVTVERVVIAAPERRHVRRRRPVIPRVRYESIVYHCKKPKK